MKIKMKGGDKWQKKYARSIAKFSLNHLLTERMLDEVVVHIELVDGLSISEGIFGDTDYEEDEDSSKLREFMIRVDSGMMMRALLETVAHEIVHVKQYARGEIKDLCHNNILYKNKKYKLSMNYWDQPWEIEAHGRERGLFEMWSEKAKLNKELHPWAFENYHAENMI